MKHWIVVMADGTKVDVLADDCGCSYDGTLEFSLIQKNEKEGDEYTLLKAFATGVWKEVDLLHKSGGQK